MRRVLLAVLAALPGLATGAGAQELPLRRDRPAVAWAGCPPPRSVVAPRAPAREEATRLTAAATQASILGDNEAAREQLARAASLDPASADIAYRLARTLDVLGRRDQAVAEYCRYLALAGDTPDTPEVTERLALLADAGGFAVSAAALQSYDSGIAHYDAGRLPEAEFAFGAAWTAAPSWAAPLYNRALVRLALQQRDAAAQDLRRYLELSPGAPDFDRILDVLGSFRSAAPAPYDPRRALTAGLLVPGLGHFTTDRPIAGLIVLGTAAAAIATGLLVERLEVDCLSPPVNGRCPPDQVLRQHSERPYLLPAVAVGAAAGIAGAIDAFRSARARNRRAAEPPRSETGGAEGASLALPTLHVSPAGARVELLRLRF